MAYNGWSNYETWCVALWIDNEEGSYHEARKMARRSRSESHLAESLKDWISEMAPDLGASMFSDLLSAALSGVDWYEIAAHYWQDEEHNSDDDEEASNA